jgi:hypothetical protein
VNLLFLQIDKDGNYLEIAEVTSSHPHEVVLTLILSHVKCTALPDTFGLSITDNFFFQRQVLQAVCFSDHSSGRNYPQTP